MLSLVYSSVLFVSLLLAFLLRFDFNIPEEFVQRFWFSVYWIIPVKLVFLSVFGQFRTLLTFFSLPDAKMIGWAMLSSAVIEMGVWLVLQGEGIVPRGVIAADLVISFLALAAVRTGLRVYRERFIGEGSTGSSSSRLTAILGTGPSAAMLLRDIQTRRGLALKVLCFVDDDHDKIGSSIHGLPVLGPLARLPQITKSLGLQKVIIAMPEAGPKTIKDTVAAINSLGLDHDILPSFAQMLHRHVTVSHLRQVEPEDLLGRKPVSLDESGIDTLLGGKRILVTGAGGSIGSELCRQIAEHNPALLILVERSEPALFSIEQELLKSSPGIALVPRAHDVCDDLQIGNLLQHYRPEIVFHAAAHKHVPLMESQPAEALRNNALGTAVVARLSGKHRVEKFVLISTDKAVNPANIMGATKRMAEMVVEECHSEFGEHCSYSAVRFGNVLGSSGSVIPVFRRQIAEGGPVTVTHPDMTRFFMSISEAVGLILQSAFQSSGGEIFVLDMGEPVRIDDLARQMIELSGFRFNRDIQVVYTGLRPGEKLREESVRQGETVGPTTHPKVKVIRNHDPSGAKIIESLQSIFSDSNLEYDILRRRISSLVPEFRNHETAL